MKFDDDAQLDTSQIDDQRGRSLPGGALTAGGGLGVIGLIIAILLGANPLSGGGSSSVSTEGATDLAAECQTGAQANVREDCRVVGIVNSVQKFWTDELAASGGYQATQTRFFTGQINTGCGGATSAVGPFYCPADKNIYLDLGFFEDLRTKFGAQGGPFAQAYVVAHEYAHHVQDLQGTTSGVRSGATGPTSGAVRLELQADCYAGLWAHGAVQTGYLTELTDADIDDGLNAAAAIGDDRIQSQTQGRVNPESWTHGSSAQRQRWFNTGYRSGEMAACDTFAAPQL